MTTAVRLADDAAGLMYSADDLAGIVSDLSQIGTEAYQQRLTEIGQRAGLTPGTLEPAVEAAIAERAARNGASIVNTHNNDLAGWLERNPDGDPQQWEAARAEWKSRQIAFNEAMQNRAAADQDFIDRNDVSSAVMMKVVPEDAVCPICQGYVDMDWMTQDEAAGIDLPAHINCSHGWEYSDNLGDQVSTRADVWLGRWTDEEDGPTWTAPSPPPGLPPASELPGGGARTGNDVNVWSGPEAWKRDIQSRFNNAAATGEMPPLPSNWDILTPAQRALWQAETERAQQIYAINHPTPPGGPAGPGEPGGAIPRDRPLQPGTVLTATYKGQDYRLEVRQGPDGNNVYTLPDGREFKSLSAAGNAVTGTSVNGWKFWSIDQAPPPPTPPVVTSEGATAIDRSKPLESGQTLIASYKGEDFTLEVRTGADGSLVYATGGVEYSSLSAAARGVTGNSVNGWAFWKVPAGEAGTAPTPGTVTGIDRERMRQIGLLGPNPAPKAWYDLTTDEQAVWARYHPNAATDGKPDAIWAAEQQAKQLGYNPTVQDWKLADPTTQWVWQRTYPNIPPDQAAWVDVTGHGQFKAPDGTDQPTTWRYMTTREQTNWLTNHTPGDWRYSSAPNSAWLNGEAPMPQGRPDLIKLSDMDPGANPVKRTAKDEIERVFGDLRAKYYEIFQAPTNGSTYQGYNITLRSVGPKDYPNPGYDRAYAWNAHWRGEISFNAPKTTTNPSEWEANLRNNTQFIGDSGLPFHPPGNTTMEATAAHEFGHSVQDFLDNLPPGRARDVYQEYEHHQAGATTTISDYGVSGRDPVKERFAESFADAWMRTEHPDQAAWLVTGPPNPYTHLAPGRQVKISDIPPSTDEEATAEMLNKVFSILRNDPTLDEKDRDALGRLFPSSFHTQPK